MSLRIPSFVARLLPVAAFLVLGATRGAAQDLSTHVLDLARGTGGVGVPVTLERRVGDEWRAVARAVTDENGRVRAFAGTKAEAGVFRLVFDMRAYGVQPAATGAAPRRPFFPEIVVVFEVPDTAHYHVPVVVSPYGYSTYRGN